MDPGVEKPAIAVGAFDGNTCHALATESAQLWTLDANTLAWVFTRNLSPRNNVAQTGVQHRYRNITSGKNKCVNHVIILQLAKICLCCTLKSSFTYSWLHKRQAAIINLRPFVLSISLAELPQALRRSSNRQR